MTLEKFISLDYEGRMQATMKAVCIAGRDENKFMIFLYQLHDFYIEVYYHRKYSYISELLPFDSTDRLEPYLEKIPISKALFP